MNIISVKNLSKDFGQERVLKSVTRDFEKGRIHGIVGNNGSGKTVLMKCIRLHSVVFPPPEGPTSATVLPCCGFNAKRAQLSFPRLDNSRMPFLAAAYPAHCAK